MDNTRCTTKRMSDLLPLIFSKQELLKWEAKKISDILSISFDEALENIQKSRLLFQSEKLEECLNYADSLCEWILSKELDEKFTEWARYTCFKLHVGWIDSIKYDKIIDGIPDKLKLWEGYDQEEGYE